MNSPVCIQNQHFSLEILPSLGGKISSLIDRQTGREWLWSNPHLPRCQPVYGESYIEKGDFGGWDEIFPSVTPVQFPDGTSIPDHGEIVFLPAEVIHHDDYSVTTVTKTRAYSARFTRSLTLNGPQLLIDYALESFHTEPVPYLWASHPLIALESGMAIILPSDQLTIHSVDTSRVKDFPVTTLPSGGCRLDISDPDLNPFTQPASYKIFTAEGTTSELSILAPDECSLRFSWDIANAPYLGLWLNLRGWSGSDTPPYFNLGIEPTTAPHDSLLDAIRDKQQRVLQPSNTHTWSLRITLGNSKEASFPNHPRGNTVKNNGHNLRNQRYLLNKSTTGKT